MEQELTKYRLLNIFYNRGPEIELLKEPAEEEQIVKETGKKAYAKWLKERRALFRSFLHEKELERRREHRNLEKL
jgi:hypothetical protein